MINETNDSLDTIMSTVSEEHLQHQEFLDEMEKKEKQRIWYWKMLGVTVIIAVVWIAFTSWWFESGSSKTAGEGKHIKNPYAQRK